MKPGSVCSPDFGLTKVAEALFNLECCSDLTIVVNDDTFHCHKAIMVPVSGYLQRYLNWPPKNGDDQQDKASKSVVAISMPKIFIPIGFESDETSTPAQCFELYLKVIYGLYHLDIVWPDKTMAVFAVADFMDSASVAELCDNDFLSLPDDVDDALEIALFCQKYRMPKTFESVKHRIANSFANLSNEPYLYQLDHETFLDIVKLCEPTAEQFWIIVAYTSGHGAFPECLQGPVHITDDRMLQLFKQAVQTVSPGWDQDLLDEILDVLDKTEFVSGPDDKESGFLYKTMLHRYRHGPE